MTALTLDAGAVAALLAERAEPLATEVVGAPPTSRSRDQVRFFEKGGLVVEIAGPRRGIWCSFGDGQVGGDALDLVRHFRRCSTRQALAWAAAWLGIAGEVGRPASPRAHPSTPAAEPGGKDTSGLARRLWRESVPPAGTLAEIYLRSRGLRLPDGAPLRFHPSCRRGVECLPAMVALMTHPVTARPVGVHRTYLRSDGAGKAAGNSKQMLGRAGIIRLVPDDEVSLGIGIAEGVETGLAVMQCFGWRPVWAATSAGAIRRFPILDGVDCLSVFADADDMGGGLDAARTCADRWRAAKREAIAFLPPSGTDWHDVSWAVTP